MNRRSLLLTAVAATATLLVLSGCSAPTSAGELGEEGSYSATDPIPVTTGDGLNESERESLLARTMARIEVVRGVEFTNTTAVEVISRAEFRNRTGGGGDPTNLTDRQLWNEQVWEALFIVGEDTTYPATRSTNRGTSVVGYYSNSRIVLVSDSETPMVDRNTLVHELVHALQDQRFNFGTNPRFQDRQLAEQGLTEGDANYVTARYRQRCDGEWDCIPIPERNRTRPDGFNQALFLTSYAPYSEGPQFVQALRQRDGWRTVNDAYDSLPVSTEQVIHPETYPSEAPIEVTVPDRSTDAWNRFTDIGRPVHDVVGEASIYAMFQGNGIAGRTDRSQYDYDHPFSAGWAGDALVPYRNGDAYGYVWRTRWDSTDDAREFIEGYRELLTSRGATSLDGNRYRILDSDPFGDAFRLSRSGQTVTVVNAPSADALDRIHALTGPSSRSSRPLPVSIARPVVHVRLPVS